MVRDFARSYYKSAYWARLQKLCMERSETTVGTVPPFMCERCYQNGVLRPAKVVHHIVHVTPDNIDDPKVTRSADNLMRLCQDCHAYVHSNGERDTGRVFFDEFGNVVRRDDEWKA